MSAAPLPGVRDTGVVAGPADDDARDSRSLRGTPAAIRLADSAARFGSSSAAI